MTYYDVAWTEYFRELGITYQKILEEGMDLITVKATIEFKSPAYFDDILEIYATVSEIGNSSLTFDYEIHKQDSGVVVSIASFVYVNIDRDTTKPSRISDKLRNLIENFEKRSF